MWKLIVKEKTGVVGGWLEVDGAVHELLVGEYENEVDAAIELLAVWSDWMNKEINSVQTIYTERGGRLSLRPDMVESIALVYARS